MQSIMDRNPSAYMESRGSYLQELLQAISDRARRLGFSHLGNAHFDTILFCLMCHATFMSECQSDLEFRDLIHDALLIMPS